MTDFDTAVVGAGVFGAAAALELRRRGHEVVLLDRGPSPHPDASSTDVSKMVRMDYGSDVFYHELAEAALAGWDRWNAEWPTPPYHETGFLVLSRTEMTGDGFEAESWRVLRERGYRPERIRSEELARRYPMWRADRYPDGYLSRRGGWAASGAVVERLTRLGSDAGVVPLVAPRWSLLERDGGVRGVRLDGGRDVSAKTVVVCTGAWTATLLPWLAPAMGATGQPVLHVRAPDPDAFSTPHFTPFAADISGSGWYGFPALPDGSVKLGHHAAGRAVDPGARGEVGARHLERARGFLRRSLPELAEGAVTASRVCLYCDTFDGDLWIDHDPDRPGLVVATGGSGHGFKFAPVLGPIIADVVEREPNRWASRFRWREPGRRRMEEARYEGA